jgi:hypothetical protein
VPAPAPPFVVAVVLVVDAVPLVVAVVLVVDDVTSGAGSDGARWVPGTWVLPGAWSTGFGAPVTAWMSR